MLKTIIIIEDSYSYRENTTRVIKRYSITNMQSNGAIIHDGVPKTYFSCITRQFLLIITSIDKSAKEQSYGQHIFPIRHFNFFYLRDFYLRECFKILMITLLSLYKYYEIASLYKMTKWNIREIFEYLHSWCNIFTPLYVEAFTDVKKLFLIISVMKYS